MADSKSEQAPLLSQSDKERDQNERGRSDHRHRHYGSGHNDPSASPFRSPSTSPRAKSRNARSRLRHESVNEPHDVHNEQDTGRPNDEASDDGDHDDDDDYDDEEPDISPLYILPLNFFNAFAWSLIEVPLIYLLRTRLCEDKFGDRPGSLPYESDKCRAQDIQIQVSGIRAGFQTIAAVLGVATTASYGVISDSRGRRHVMLTSSFLSLLGDLSLLGIVMLPGYTNPKYVLISAVFKGLAGYVSAIVAAQNAFVADTTVTDNRARYLGWNFATYHLGTAMGPLISGVLVSRYDRMDIVYGIGVGLWGLYFLYTLVLLPESNRDAVRRQQQQRWSSADGGRRGSFSSMLSSQSARDSVVQTYGWFRRVTKQHLLEPLSVVLPHKVQDDDGNERYDVLGGTQESRRHWDVCLAAVLIALTLFSNGSMGMLPLYTDYKLGWGSLQASLLMSVDSFASAIALTFAFPFIGWAIGRFLRAYGGAAAAFSDLTVRVAWLSPTDTDVTPSSFWPWSSQARHVVDNDEERNLTTTTSNRRAGLQSYGTSNTIPTSEEFAAKRITVVKRDVWVARLGYMIAMASSTGIALSTSASGLYTSVALQALANIAVPAVQSIALNGVRNTYNGRVLAGFALVESLALVARGPAFAGIYNLTLSREPASVYWASVSVYGLCLLILVTVKLYRPLGDHSKAAQRDEARQRRRDERRKRRKRSSETESDVEGVDSSVGTSSSPSTSRDGERQNGGVAE